MDVHKMWRDLEGSTVSAVAKANGMTPQNLVALFDQAGLTGRRRADPSPSEIAAGTRKARKLWTKAQRKSRWIAARKLDAGVW